MGWFLALCATKQKRKTNEKGHYLKGPIDWMVVGVDSGGTRNVRERGG